MSLRVCLGLASPGTAIRRQASPVQVVEASQLSSEIKGNAKLIHRYNAARVAVATKDLATAKREGDAFLRESQARKNRFQVRLGHEVAGTIALEEKNYAGALAHLEQANQQDPYTLYRMGLAYEGKGDRAKAKEMFQSAAEFNQLPTLNSAFVREKTRKLKV